MRGFRKVAINCSACLYAIRQQYPAEGVQVRAEVVALADVLAPAAANLACQLQRKSVYYHDPCYHARYNDVIETPRKALAQLVEVRELAWNKQDTECCGGGGLLPKTMPLVADQMSKRRLAEVHATGGGMVVTSCATCAFMLKRNAPASVEVANLATAMACCRRPVHAAGDERERRRLDVQRRHRRTTASSPAARARASTYALLDRVELDTIGREPRRRPARTSRRRS